MASGMEDRNIGGEIFTCDFSNAIELPWKGNCKIHQFVKTSSTEMLKRLNGTFDFVFIDGRVQPDDLGLLDRLISTETIFALDDFEGIEKGVLNLNFLSQLIKLRSHIVIYPPAEDMLYRHGLTNDSVMAILLPISLLELSKQG